MAEHLSNDFTTTLNGGINNSTTSVTVNSGTGAPAANFRIRVDDELMLVTSTGTGTNWTVTRNIEGSAAAAHSDGTTVAHVITSAGLAQYLSENYAVIGHDQTVTLAAGTFTPALTNVANVASSSASVCQYMRVGSTVTMSGKVTINPTSGGGTITRLGIALPVASTFSADNQLGGVASLDGTGQSSGTFASLFALKADSTNHRAEMNGLAYWSSSSIAVWFSCTYQII